MADSSLLDRILDNLLDNAIKFSSPAGGVLLGLRLRDGAPVFEVIDQGPGIPAGEQNNVFLPYVQLHNPARERAQGIGLGLSIVKEAAILLGATLSLTSREGRGSRFRLRLPASCLCRLPAVPPLPERNKRDATVLAGKRLLIVEDDPMVAAALCQWAQSWGMQSRHHAEPEHVSIGDPADLVICDIRLPGEHDGIHWLSHWLGEWPDAGGLLVSGEASEVVLDRAEQEGLLLLSKPVDPDQLLATLVRLTR